MGKIEKRYLIKHLPDDLKQFPTEEIIDIYFPANIPHPKIRIRKINENYEICKKGVINTKDASTLKKEKIDINKLEFNELCKVDGRKVHKIRHRYKYDGKPAEIDVFQDKLKGLILVDFRFETPEERDNFVAPEFCLKDVTDQEFLACGMLCGKSYEEIESKLKELGYEKIL